MTQKIIDAHMHVIPAFCGERNGTPLHGCGYGKVRYSEKGNWRPGTRRGEWRVMPPSFIDTTTPPHVVSEYLDYAGIDAVVCMQSMMYGNHNEYLAELVRSQPDRFIAAFAFVDPRIGAEAVDELDWIHHELGLVGVKLEPPDMPFWLNDKTYDPFWKKMERLGSILSIDLGWDPRENEYNFQIEPLHDVVDRHPDLTVLIQHLGVSYLWDKTEQAPYPSLQKTLALEKYPNVWFDITGLPEFCPGEEYPYLRAQEIVKVAVEAVGAERVIWGSDFPGILPEDVTYKQCLNVVRNHCTFLSDEEMDMILGGSVLRLLAQGKCD